MTVYFILYAVIFVIALFNKSFTFENDKTKRFFCFVAFATITAMLALRHQSMGVDLVYESSYGYLGNFDRISTISWKNIFKVEVANYETGYIIFNKIISSIYNDRQFFLGVCAIFSILPMAWVIYKESVSPLLSFIIYLGLPSFLMNYSGLRQALAIGICFLSIHFIKEKKIIKFILLVLLASQFHYSSIIFLVSYPVYHLKLSDAMRKLSVFIIPIVYIIRRPLFVVLSKVLKDEVTPTDNDSGLLFVVFVLIYIFCIIYADNNSSEQNGLMNLFLLACFCQTFGNVYQTAMRVGYYFMVSLVVLLPLIINSREDLLDKKFFTFIITVAFAVFGLYSIYTSTWACAYPYYFYWQSV